MGSRTEYGIDSLKQLGRDGLKVGILLHRKLPQQFRGRRHHTAEGRQNSLGNGGHDSTGRGNGFQHLQQSMPLPERYPEIPLYAKNGSGEQTAAAAVVVKCRVGILRQNIQDGSAQIQPGIAPPGRLIEA